MKLQFLGANRQVTGSRYCIETAGVRIMVDCGMFQERRYADRNWAKSPVPPSELHALLLTHVHIDHCGLLPRLVAQGFRGPIYCTHPTAALAPVMLLDAARIQEEEAAYKKKRHQREGRRGKHPEVPLFTEADAKLTLSLLKSFPYSTPIAVHDRISVTLFDAGHILGSAIIQVDVTEGDRRVRILLSGDLGQWDKPLVRDPTLLEEADYVVLESTYGDRLHGDSPDIGDRLAEIVQRTIERGGNVVIPTFAVERAQELIYHLGELVHKRRIANVPVYLDSPMAADVNEIFSRFPDCFDQEAFRRMATEGSPLNFPGLHLVRTVEHSKAINNTRRPCIIMSTSGMCTQGRIKHHLRHNVERPESTILFVGYQAEGTLGRQIVKREPRIRIHGHDYRLRAEVEQLQGFSAHGDQQDLLRWVGNIKNPRRVFLTHGEEQAAMELARQIRERFDWDVSVPHYEQEYSL